jgi:hypothetical protein
MTQQSDDCKSNLTGPRIKKAGLRSGIDNTLVSNTPRDGPGRSLTCPQDLISSRPPFLITTAFPSRLMWPVPAGPKGLSPATLIRHLSLQTLLQTHNGWKTDDIHVVLCNRQTSNSRQNKPQSYYTAAVLRLGARPINRGSFPSWVEGFFFTLKRPGQPGGPPILLFNGYQGPFPGNMRQEG